MRFNISVVLCSLILLACAEPSAPVDQLANLLEPTFIGPDLQLTARLDGNSLVYIVAHNATTTPDTLLCGPCSFAARVYTGSDYSVGSWQSVPNVPLPCAASLRIVVVAGQDSAAVLAAQLDRTPPNDPPPPPHGQVRAYLLVGGHLQTLIAGIRDLAVVQGRGAVLASPGLNRPGRLAALARDELGPQIVMNTASASRTPARGLNPSR